MGQVSHLLDLQPKFPWGSLVLKDIAMHTHTSHRFSSQWKEMMGKDENAC